MIRQGVRVDLGDDERYVGVAPEGRRVVDHRGALLHEARSPLERGPASGREERDVEATQVGAIVEQLHGAAIDLGSGRPRRGEEDDLVSREVALGQQREHRPAHGAGGANDSHAHAAGSASARMLALRVHGGARVIQLRHRGPCSGSMPPSPSSKAACRERTAWGTWSARMMHEILIGEVEIISMLMFWVANVSKTLKATPGCERMPAPTIETLPISRSVSTRVRPSCPTSGSSACSAARRSS